MTDKAVLAISIDGCLRLRKLGRRTSVVETRPNLYPGAWRYCAWKSLSDQEAEEFFLEQARYHSDPSIYNFPVVSPGE